jgi:hypothetical protein
MFYHLASANIVTNEEHDHIEQHAAYTTDIILEGLKSPTPES